MTAHEKHVFISYSRANKAFVNRLITRLQEEGLNIWIDKQGLKPGTRNWEQALRDAINGSYAVLLVASPASRRSAYVNDELAIAEMFGRRVYPVWGDGEQWMDSIPMGMGKIQFIDARGEAFETGIDDIVDALAHDPNTPFGADDLSANVPGSAPIAGLEAPQAEDDDALPADFVPRNPYKGLKPFSGRDRGDFFGRERLIVELLDTMHKAHPTQDNERILALVGPSGSGKSSVMMAGLLPRLQGGGVPESSGVPGSESWVYLTPVRPGTRPIEALATAIGEMIPAQPVNTIREGLMNQDARGLHQYGQQIARGRRMVVLIDQFEEIFTQVTDENIREQFVNLLVTAVTEPEGAVMVMLTLRADFYDRPMQYAQLGQLLENHSKSVLPMSLSDLYDVVQKPALLPDTQLIFDDGLVPELVFEVRDQPGGLPLLQFTLEQLFQRREGRHLTRAAYDAIGGLRGALAQHAEETYQALPDDETRKMARAVFLRLVEVGAGDQDTTRRRATLDSLTPTDPIQADRVNAVVDAFVTARLFITGQDSEGTTVEVSHEALLREWQRFKDWLRVARDDIAIQQSISADVGDWQQRDEPDDRLYRGSQLQEAQAWAERNLPNRAESNFIEKSLAFEAAEIEREERRQRAVRRLRYAILSAAGLFIAVVVVFLILLAQQQQGRIADQESAAATSAVQSTAVADQRDLAATNEARAVTNEQLALENEAEAQANLFTSLENQSLLLTTLSEQELADGAPGTALLLALDAMQFALDDPPIYSPEAQNALAASLANPQRELLYLQHDGPVLGATFNTDETQVITWSEGRDVFAWDLTTEPLEPVALSHTGRVLGAVWLDDGSVVVWSDDGSIALWPDFHSFPFVRDHGATLTEARLSADGAQLLTWSNVDASAKLWDLTDPRAEPAEFVHDDGLLGAAWSDDGALILTWSRDGSARLWESDIPESPFQVFAFDNADAELLGASLSPDGATVGAWNNFGDLSLWPVGDTQPIVYNAGDTVDALYWRPFTAGRGYTFSALTSFGTLLSPQEGELVEAFAARSSVVLALPGGELLSEPPPPEIVGASVDDVGGELSLIGAEGTTALIPYSGARLRTVDVSADALLITTGAPNANDGQVLVWDRTPAQTRLTLDLSAPVNGARFTADGGHLWTWDGAANGDEGGLRLWSLNQIDYPIRMDHGDRVDGYMWSADETRVLTWSQSSEGAAYIWSVDDPASPLVLPHDDAVNGAAWNADETEVLTWAADGSVRVWPLATRGAPLVVRIEGRVRHAAWSPDESRLLVVPLRGNAVVYDLASPGVPVELPGAAGVTNSGGMWHPDGERVLVFDSEGGARLFDVERPESPENYASDYWVQGATWSADAASLLVWSGGFVNDTGEVRVFSMDDPDNPLILPHDHYVFGASWNGDESRILSWSGDPNGSTDGVVLVWELSAPEAPAVTLSHDDYVFGAQWSPDETMVVTQASDFLTDTGLVRLWSLEAPEAPMLILRHDDFVNSVQWSADGSRLLTASDDGTARIYDLSTPDSPLILPHAEGHAFGAMWSADETRVLTWSGDFGDRIGGARVWAVTPADVLALGQAAAIRDYTAAERARLLITE